ATSCTSDNRCLLYSSVFFFQAEDGIRDFHVTGVQTCALPIYYETACKIERRLAGPWDARVAVAMANMHRSRGELSRALAVLDRVVSDFEITAELKERVEAELRAL